MLDLTRRINTSFAEFFKEIGCVGEVVLVDSPEVHAILRVSRHCTYESCRTLQIGLHADSFLKLILTCDYNRGVDRMVQFRDNSTLSCMNAQEHSGGVYILLHSIQISNQTSGKKCGYNYVYDGTTEYYELSFSRGG